MSTNPIDLNEWRALAQHQQEIASDSMRAWFAQDSQRFSRFSLTVDELLLDYSRHRISEKTIALLCKLAHAISLPTKIEALFTGQSVNITENRPALHTALRHPQLPTLLVNGENIGPLIAKSQTRMHEFVSSIHAQQWRGITGKPITQVVNIGIGGSHLGPKMATHALKDFAVGNMDIFYISSVDDAQLDDLLQTLNPESTLFIISSKSFSTIETLTNAQTLCHWMQTQLGEHSIPHHFIAVTAAPEKARAFGLPEENIFPLWEWVGGRYSVWSAISLPLMLSIGVKHFNDFLTGAHEMDQHFRQAEFSQNMPVLLGMLSVWYMNFFGTTAEAIIPYSHRLRYLIPYLQQAGMESYGKRVNRHGENLACMAGPILFGEEGCDGQHAYHQLLHQGQHLVPVDFIMTGSHKSSTHAKHHNILLASCLSQATALMQGKTYEESYDALIKQHYTPESAEALAPHLVIPGNKPSSILLLQQLSPKNLGALIALYEHKIFVQSAIWDINPFDQWGVELGKQLLPTILKQIQHSLDETDLDSATTELISYLSHREPS